jgi:hypothetical protein
MKAQQTASMADGNQRCPGQGFAQQSIHRQLECFVQCGAGIIEKHHGRSVQQHPTYAQALLLAEG